jgi:ABC-type glucose/galactose transport system permease subunit
MNSLRKSPFIWSVVIAIAAWGIIILAGLIGLAAGAEMSHWASVLALAPLVAIGGLFFMGGPGLIMGLAVCVIVFGLLLMVSYAVVHLIVNASPPEDSSSDPG